MLTFDQWLAQNYPNIEFGSEAGLLKYSEYEAYVAGYVETPEDPEDTGILSFEEWLADRQYNASAEMWGYYRNYVIGAGGNDPGEGIYGDGNGDDDLLDSGRDDGDGNGDGNGDGKNPDQLLYDEYVGAGGTLSFAEWTADGKPATPADETIGDGDGDGGDVDQSLPYLDAATGRWVDPLTGKSFSTENDAWDSFNAETDRLRFQEELTGLQEESEADIERVGGEEAARARQLEAQRTGHALRRAENIMRSRGRTAGEIQQLTAGGIEGASRSLAGLLTDINLQTQRTQAQLAQQSIGTALTAEGISLEQSRLGVAKSQFQQDLEETRRQFGLGQTLTREQMEQQQSQFTSGLGFDQAWLAQAQAQFDEQLKEERRRASASGWGSLFGTVAGGIGGFFLGGPAAVIPGAAVGQGMFG